MKCKEVRRLLAVYRELNADERALVDAHVATCQACAERLAVYTAQEQALAGLPHLSVAALPGDVLAAAHPLPAQPVSRHWGYALALALFLLVTGFGATARVSADALPGDPLYGIKRAMETLRQTITVRESARQALVTELSARRLGEAQQVQAQRRTAELGFEGAVQAAQDDVWIVSGVAVTVEPSVWAAAAPLGQVVRIEARAVDGEFEAVELHLHAQQATQNAVGYPGPAYPAPAWAPGAAYPAPGATVDAGYPGPNASDTGAYPGPKEPTSTSTTGNETSGNETSGNETSGNAYPGADEPGNLEPANNDPGNADAGNADEGNADPGNVDAGNAYPGPEETGNDSSGNSSSGNSSSGSSSQGSGSSSSGSSSGGHGR